MTTQSSADRIRQRMSELIAQGVDPRLAIQQATEEVNPTGGQGAQPGAQPPFNPASPAQPFPTGTPPPAPGPGDFGSVGADPFSGGDRPGLPKRVPARAAGRHRWTGRSV